MKILYRFLVVTAGLVSTGQAFRTAASLGSSGKLHELALRKQTQTLCSAPAPLRSASWQLYQSSESTNETPSFALNPLAGAAWIGLVSWAFTIAPGSLGSPQDQAMIEAIVADPIHPGINEIYYTIFNFFAVMPVILASIAAPQGQNKGLPSAPFLISAAFFGYISSGPYFALRAPPRDKIEPDQVSWFTRNVLENKIFSWSILAFTLYLPFAAGVFPALQQDASGLFQGFVDLITTSRFAAVSIVDLFVLYVTIIALTPRDYLLRQPDASPSDATKLALATAVLPFLGSAIYCALRPPLPLED